MLELLNVNSIGQGHDVLEGEAAPRWTDLNLEICMRPQPFEEAFWEGLSFD